MRVQHALCHWGLCVNGWRILKEIIYAREIINKIINQRHQRASWQTLENLCPALYVLQANKLKTVRETFQSMNIFRERERGMEREGKREGKRDERKEAFTQLLGTATCQLLVRV